MSESFPGFELTGDDGGMAYVWSPDRRDCAAVETLDDAIEWAKSVKK